MITNDYSKASSSDDNIWLPSNFRAIGSEEPDNQEYLTDKFYQDSSII